MKTLRHLSLLIILCCAFTSSKAQYVTIPDAAFAGFLRTYYAACMNGNQMDTTCATIRNATSLNVSRLNIWDIEGLQYFRSLRLLDVSDNGLIQLPALPPALQSLKANNNSITQFPSLPASLKVLDISGNYLVQCPVLPANLETFYCGLCSLDSLPVLPLGLLTLQCNDNPLHNLPTLPASLTTLSAGNNSLSALPALPPGLVQLDCYKNQLQTLPALPTTLRMINCWNNQLTQVPALPPGLTVLTCANNLLTSLPDLPDSMHTLSCYNNPQMHCLPRLTRIFWLTFDSSITCLPNYGQVYNSQPLLSNIPLCGPGSGCQSNWNISGKVYYDANLNCMQGAGETNVPYTKINLRRGGIIEQQTYTAGFGVYSFENDTGSFTLDMDTTGVPFTVSCPFNGVHAANITAIDSQQAYHFAVQCKPGFDVAVHSIISPTVFRPAFFNTLKIRAGDGVLRYNQTCNMANVSGQLVTIISGAVHYTGPAPGALTPTTVSGDTLTYTIANWAAVNADSAFNIITQTDTNAPAGSYACFAVTASTNATDNFLPNNNYTGCFNIVNSFDPNDKQVWPADNIDNSAQWLTYTIRFQNTGTAPAINIHVIDTLDAALDASSFQLLAYSHQPGVQVSNSGHYTRFNFPNINLADSVNNEPESHGYIQYRIKTLPGLNCGTRIGNAAHIYFDFNPPVATNAALNTISLARIINLQSSTCQGEPFNFNGRSLTTAGDYTDTLQASSSCDSIINLHLDVLQGAEVSESASICDGETYTWRNRSLTARDTYTDTLQTTTGCDSVLILNLEVYTGYSAVVDTAILAGTGLVLPSGTTVTAPGNYTDTLQSIFGCDSIIITRLSVISGIENIATNATMQLYPNPATDMVMINLSDNLTGGTLTLRDVTGRSLNTINITANHNQLNTGALSSGVYLVTAVKGGTRVVQRLVVSK